MSIFGKRLTKKRYRKTGNGESLVDGKDPSTAEKPAEAEDRDQPKRENYSIDYEIDIRLDQDLSNYNAQQRGARAVDEELDFDVTSPDTNIVSFAESQVLRVDPTKTFSRQVDINLRKLEAGGYINPLADATPLSNNFRQLKRPILNNADGKGATVLENGNVIMVTSSVEGEGKTFSAINMALSLAMERDRHVLLIDADVNKPSHHEIFGLQMQQGLTDYLIGRVSDTSRIMCKTNIPSLSLIFAGKPSPHSIELFASKTMKQFVDDLSSRYDDRIVIFDSAPLLLPTEASVLAAQMGQIIMIVEAEKTTHDDVRKSLDLLSNEIVLLVLNKMHEKTEHSIYGYHAKYAG